MPCNYDIFDLKNSASDRLRSMSNRGIEDRFFLDLEFNSIDKMSIKENCKDELKNELLKYISDLVVNRNIIQKKKEFVELVGGWLGAGAGR